jgi:hypothetical protein
MQADEKDCATSIEYLTYKEYLGLLSHMKGIANCYALVKEQLVGTEKYINALNRILADFTGGLESYCDFESSIKNNKSDDKTKNIYEDPNTKIGVEEFCRYYAIQSNDLNQISIGGLNMAIEKLEEEIEKLRVFLTENGYQIAE